MRISDWSSTCALRSRLADGREVPCFGLTGPFAGSDATSISDYGIICQGEWNGASVLGIKLTFDKRYITLAPVATIIGLAFRLYDPDGLIGDTNDIDRKSTSRKSSH